MDQVYCDAKLCETNNYYKIMQGTFILRSNSDVYHKLDVQVRGSCIITISPVEDDGCSAVFTVSCGKEGPAKLGNIARLSSCMSETKKKLDLTVQDGFLLIRHMPCDNIDTLNHYNIKII
jgi:ABC-type uncharacterized transport system ATPase subunit